MSSVNVDLSGAAWFKSTRSATQDTCVEAAHLSAGHVGVRDSKNPAGPTLIFTPGAWDAFVSRVKNGEFDRP